MGCRLVKKNLFINLMPFIYARFNKQISNDQLTVVLKKFIPDLTAKL